MGYALNFRLAPVRRELDYLRTLGASKESAKELKLFCLSSFLTGRYKKLSEDVYRQNIDLARRKLRVGAPALRADHCRLLFGVCVCHLSHSGGRLERRNSDLLAGAIAGASNNIQMMFSTFAGIADQALFLTDLLRILCGSAGDPISPRARFRAPRRFQSGFEFQNVSFAYPGNSRLILDNLSLRIEPGGADRLDWRKWPREKPR